MVHNGYPGGWATPPSHAADSNSPNNNHTHIIIIWWNCF